MEDVTLECARTVKRYNSSAATRAGGFMVGVFGLSIRSNSG